MYYTNTTRLQIQTANKSLTLQGLMEEVCPLYKNEEALFLLI